MDLLYCGNAAVFDGVLLSAWSAVRKSTVPLHFHLMTMDLTDLDERYTPITAEQADFIQTVLQREDEAASVTLIDATEAFKAAFAGCENLGGGYTPYTLLRLVADRFALPDKLLYVDCDTLFCSDIAAVQPYMTDENELAGAVDAMGRVFINKGYINAGVLYMNMAALRQSGALENARQICRTEELPFPDQDALNRAVTKKGILPRGFNEQIKRRKDTVIRHFAKTIRFFPYFRILNIKPWDVELVHSVLKEHAFDELYALYLSLRASVTGTLAPARTIRQMPPFFQKFKADIREVRQYAKQNGGVFRKNNKKGAAL